MKYTTIKDLYDSLSEEERNLPIIVNTNIHVVAEHINFKKVMAYCCKNNGAIFMEKIQGLEFEKMQVLSHEHKVC